MKIVGLSISQWLPCPLAIWNLLFGVAILLNLVKYPIVADTLSRAFDRSAQKSITEEDVKTHLDMIKHNKVSDPMWEKIATHTKKDGDLQDVLSAMHFGWESDRGQSLKPYYHFRVLVNEPKVIIPLALQGEVWLKIHEGHLDIEKCQARARQVVYWLNINTDIENHIGQCGICQKHTNRQRSQRNQTKNQRNLSSRSEQTYSHCLAS